MQRSQTILHPTNLSDCSESARRLAIAVARDYGARSAEGCDLIVMGTHGRSGLGRALFGSTAEHVSRGARCVVATVRPVAHVSQTLTAARVEPTAPTWTAGPTRAATSAVTDARACPARPHDRWEYRFSRCDSGSGAHSAVAVFVAVHASMIGCDDQDGLASNEFARTATRTGANEATVRSGRDERERCDL